MLFLGRCGLISDDAVRRDDAHLRGLSARTFFSHVLGGKERGFPALGRSICFWQLRVFDVLDLFVVSR